MCVFDGTRRGIFIVIEGLDGAGKTTQANMLVDRLKKMNVEAVYLKEPTNGQWGMKIRRIAEHGRDHLTPEQELEYFIRDREEDSKKNIIPAIDAGKVVVMDRYIHSNAAYQGALGLSPDAIFEKNRGFPAPDVVFYMDLDPEEGLKRVNKRGTANKGFEKIEFLKNVHSLFKGGAGGFGKMTQIDAGKSTGEIAEAIWEKVSPLLEKVR